MQIAADVRADRGGEDAGDDERAVERPRTGSDAELREVQLPPLRVGGRDHREQGADDEVPEQQVREVGGAQADAGFEREAAGHGARDTGDEAPADGRQLQALQAGAEHLGGQQHAERGDSGEGDGQRDGRQRRDGRLPARHGRVLAPAVQPRADCEGCRGNRTGDDRNGNPHRSVTGDGPRSAPQ
ncbi:hypothetical protein [Microbacterium tenebrionis]|uniref:hypothetical protein n=1 Tax=Microbacterium tenebrionis TaxID=2830665 RepID=UPI00202B327C|nr:hypothetical protein [Microbacterium ihumii]